MLQWLMPRLHVRQSAPGRFLPIAPLPAPGLALATVAAATPQPLPLQAQTLPQPQASPSPAPRQLALRDAFTPTRPLVSAERLAGRQAQLARILRALREQRAHVALYAERGHGKTSLVNLVAEALRAEGDVVARFTCAATTGYGALLRGLLRDLPRSMLAAPVQEGARLEGCEAALPHGDIEPREVLALPERLAGGLAERQLVLMVDEFDRIQDMTTRTLVADTIKQVSDRGLPLSFVLVGVSDSLEQLLGHHPSIQRNLVGVPLPLLSPAEVDEMLRHGAEAAGLAMPEEARAAIAALARGVPYMAQLLALHAGHATLSRGSRAISGADLDAAISTAVEEADLRIVALYEDLTLGGRDAAMAAALRAIAAGTQDAFGRFRLEAENGEDRGTVTVAGRTVAVPLWDRLLTAPAVRSCIGVGAGLFTFTEATFGHYVLLRAAREGERALPSRALPPGG